MSKWAESPYKFASFFGPQPGLAADLVIFKVENAAGCGRAAGGWRVAAGGCARGRPLITASILRLQASEPWVGAC